MVKNRFIECMRLEKEFYLGNDVLVIARNLIGKVLFTKINNKVTAGIITETEAYNGIIDKASHAYGNRRTKRTETMYKEGGVSYIYLCYGIHSLFNVVTNVEHVPHAILIRAIVPYAGAATMLQRRNATVLKNALFNGPGKVCQALGIDYSFDGIALSGKKIWIEDKSISINKNQISATPRIGVDYAGEDALLPYRFLLKDTSNL